MTRIFTYIVLLGFAALIGCSSDPEPEEISEGEAVLEGTFAFKGSPDAYVDRPAIHYKFADRDREKMELDDEDRFHIRLEVDEPEIVWIDYDDKVYPVYLINGERVELELDGADFPKNIKQRGGDEEANRMYQQYLDEVNAIEENIDEESDNFSDDPASPLLEYYQERIDLAESKLNDTPLELIVHRARGEYIVKKLERVHHHRNNENFDAAAERQQALEKARELGVFTEESLKAQRAGIRDIAHSYAMSYGIQEQLEDEYGEGLGAYELNRLAYEELDSKRREVLEFIDDRDAMAHARMYLVAERTGEAPFEKAKPTYEAYLDEFSEYEEYISFLEDHFNQVASIQPGQPAVDFEYRDADGNYKSLEDFEGQTVLLTFWASWCANCAYQKPYLREAYEQYSDEDFEIVAISIDEEEQAWEAHVRQEDFPWVDLFAGDGFQQDTFMRYRAGSIPFYVLINPDGTIEGVNNVRPSLDLVDELEQLL